jgi:hypothetical protein
MDLTSACDSQHQRTSVVLAHGAKGRRNAAGRPEALVCTCATRMLGLTFCSGPGGGSVGGED